MSESLGTRNDGRPAVSVIIPCYNLGRFIEEAVDSVCAQSFQDFEIVIVDDGSTDAQTTALLANFARPRTQVVRTSHRGLPAARNLAIERSRGRYICALDADDRLHPQFLEKTIPLLEADPSVAFVSTWLQMFGTESWIWRQDRCDLIKLLSECVVLTAAPVRREAIDAVGGFDERFFLGDEDWDLWISIVEEGYRGIIVPEVLFYYQRRPGSRSTVCTRGNERMRHWSALLEKHRESYRRHATDVLLLKERDCGRVLRENWLLERAIEREFRPQVAARRAELLALEAELARADKGDASSAAPPQTAPPADRTLELEAALAGARAEVLALRASWSWKITAPLRRGLDLCLAAGRRLGVRGPGSGSSPRGAK